ncbi:MAG: AAA family ATPase [Calditrichaeota bacterium]|nr:AAA family ATPase [Calditrichota bacterium]
MRIESFQIHHYGPLEESPRIHLRAFNLFWGKNEDGKTLTLEALVRLLLGKDSRKLEHYLRVPEMPSGYVVVQMDEGKTIRLEGSQSISQELDIPVGIFLNLFVVRNSDLLFREGDRFYANVTELLTQSRISRISGLIERVHEETQLTSTGDIRDTEKSQKLKSRYIQAKEILKEIDRLQEEVRRQRWDQLSRELAEVRQRLKEVDERIERLEMAEQQTRYEQARRLLQEYQALQKQLQRLKGITHQAAQDWNQLESEMKYHQREIADLERALERAEAGIRQDQQQLNAMQAELDSLTPIRVGIEETLLPEWKTYQKYAEQLAQRRIGRTLWNGLLGGALAATLITLSAALSGGNIIFLVISLVILLAVITGYVFYWIRPQQRLNRLVHGLIHRGIELGVSGQTVEEVIREAEAFRREWQRKESEFQHLKARRDAETRQLEEKKRDLQSRIKDHHQLQARLEALKRELSVSSLDELNNRLQQKLEWEKQLTGIRQRLNQLLGIPEPPAGREQDIWASRLKAIAPPEGAGQQLENVTFDESALQRLRAEKKRLDQRKENLEEAVRKVREQLANLENEVRQVLRDSPEPVQCQSVFDLPRIKEQLQAFRKRVERQQWRGKTLVDILKQARKEEEHRIADLFGKESPVSQYFYEITGGQYASVRYHLEENQVQVIREDGQQLSPEQLSGGTFDQLYFAIRMALGTKVLQGRTGFFILDDPFLKADRERLEIMMKMLLELSQQGWQILYFSAKDEIREALAPLIDAGEVVLQDFPHPRYH